MIENKLVILLMIPIVGFTIIGILDSKRSRIVGLIVSILTFMESIRLWTRFDYLTTDFQYITKVGWNEDIEMVLGLDGISLIFVVLTTFLIPICILSSWDSIKYLRKEYILSFIGLEIILIGVFTVYIQDTHFKNI